MNEEERLAEALRGLGGIKSSDIFPATVKAVNDETIDVMAADGTEYFDVQLRANIDGEKGMIIKPATETTVIVGRIDMSNRLFVLMFSQFEEMTLKIDEMSIQLNKNGFVFNEGKLGLINIDILTDKINALIGAFNNHTHIIATGGIATQGTAAEQATVAPVTVPAITEKHDTLIRSDYEDEKIKH